MRKLCWPDSPKQAARGFTMNKTGAEERLDLNFGKQFPLTARRLHRPLAWLRVFEPASPPFYTGLATITGARSPSTRDGIREGTRT